MAQDAEEADTFVQEDHQVRPAAYPLARTEAKKCQGRLRLRSQ